MIRSTVIIGMVQILVVMPLAVVSVVAQSNADTPNRNLLIVVDGLRPDYITPELMPNLHTLGEQGVFGERHAAAFPTVTRVNIPSISTGSYPARHGIIHNTMWMPEMGEDSFSTGNADNLKRLEEVAEGELLTTISVGELMEEAGINEEQIKVVSNMIYLKNDEKPELLNKIVEVLQRHEEVGAIYTHAARSGAPEGAVPGTISTGVIRWDHERSADILVSPAWSDQVNEFGFAGATTRSGTATHGSDSPYDVRIRLVAAGPDIKSGIRSNVPTSNIDFIPTILHLQGIEPPESMDGRILYELLKDGLEPETVLVHEHTHRAGVSYPDGFRYQTELKTLQIGSTFYLRGAWTQRETTD